MKAVVERRAKDCQPKTIANYVGDKEECVSFLMSEMLERRYEKGIDDFEPNLYGLTEKRYKELEEKYKEDEEKNKEWFLEECDKLTSEVILYVKNELEKHNLYDMDNMRYMILEE